jgi:hypothetical protein
MSLIDQKDDVAAESINRSVAIGEVVESSEAEVALEKRVVRKIDRIVLPLMCLVYFFQCKSTPNI